ncbi:MAG: beta strand repeat-containing protein, partial [Gammaproteobacteria bacterium]
FAAIENLIGAGGDDTFELQGAASVTSITGGLGDDTLFGADEETLWLVEMLDSGMVGTTLFAEVENLTGGSMRDVFTVNAQLSGNLDAGAGVDQIILDVNGSAALLDGGADEDTLTSGDGDNAWLVDAQNGGNVDGRDFANIENAEGGLGNDTFSFESAGGLVALDGQDGLDTVEGADQVNTFTVTGDNAGTLNAQADFTNVESLVGGSAADTFVLDAVAQIPQMDGGDGDDTILGANVATDWTVSALNEGMVNNQAFTSIENLTGGDMIDTFDILANITGVVDAGGGDDVFDIAAQFEADLLGGAGDDQFRLTADLAGNAMTGSIDGGAGGDTLIGFDAANIWIVEMLNAGTLNDIAFGEVENITGGSMVDTITLNADLEGEILGGDGDDSVTLVLAEEARLVDFDGGAGSDSLNVSGGADNDRFTGMFSGGVIAYTTGAGTDHAITLANAETVSDDVFAGAFSIVTDGLSPVDVSAAAGAPSGTLDVDLGIDYGFSNKRDFALVANGADVTLTDDIALPGTLSIDAGTLASNGGVITSDSLIITNAMMMTTLNTAVRFITLSNVSGMLTINENDDLIFLSSDIGGDDAALIVTAAGNISVGGNEVLSSTDTLSLTSTGGGVDVAGDLVGQAVTLDGATGVDLGGAITAQGGSVTLMSGQATTQSGAGSIVAQSLESTSAAGLSLAGNNRIGDIMATNAGGNMLINNGVAASATVDNSGGSLTFNNTGTLTLNGLTNDDVTTVSVDRGDLNLPVDISTTGLGPTRLSASGSVNQAAAINTVGDVIIDGGSIVAGTVASTTSSAGNVTYRAVDDATINDITALTGSVFVTSERGNIFAAQDLSKITSDNINFSGFQAIGLDGQGFEVQSQSATGQLDVSTPDNTALNLLSFFSDPGNTFVRSGSRSEGIVDRVAQQAAAVFGIGLSATLGAEADADSAAYDPDVVVTDTVGRGVAIPCSQIADEEEACQ